MIGVGIVMTTGRETGTETEIGNETETDIGTETGIEIERGTGPGNGIVETGLEMKGTTAPHLEKTAETPAMKATPPDIEDTETVTNCVSLDKRSTPCQHAVTTSYTCMNATKYTICNDLINESDIFT